MKQRLAAMLVGLFGFLSIAPASLALSPGEDSNLPACCRRAGLHRCSLRGLGTSGPALQSTACPLFPSAHVTPAFGNAAAASLPGATMAWPITRFAAPTPANVRVPVLFIPTRYLRGPPAVFYFI